MFKISSQNVVVRLSDINTRKFNIVEKVSNFMKSINNSIESIRGNNDLNEVLIHFKDEITEDEAEDLESILRKSNVGGI